jgi:hypothetical protein
MTPLFNQHLQGLQVTIQGDPGAGPHTFCFQW